jgi:hypothetical protein
VTPELVLDARAELGEGPIWDADRARLLFVDIMRGHVHEFDPSTGRDRIVDVGLPVGAVAPTTRGDWVIAARDGFFRVDPGTGATTLIAHIEQDDRETRMNDGYVDARGRFWAGTMGMGGVLERGSLYRLDPDGRVTATPPACTSPTASTGPDGRLMYYTDTGISRVDVFDFDEPGTISNRRAFVTIPEHEGFPDGSSSMPAAASGSRSGKAARSGVTGRRDARPDGADARLARHEMRVRRTGSDDRHHYRVDRSRRAGRAREPLAGGLFRIRPGVRGRAAPGLRVDPMSGLAFTTCTSPSALSRRCAA